MNEEQEKFWIDFKQENPIFKNITFGAAWSFGNTKELADELAVLVLIGRKTATASAFIQYEKHKKPLPKVNPRVFDILLNGEQKPVAILQNTTVYVTTFDAVSEDHAYKEGEGDKSLNYWKKVHLDFWKKSLKMDNLNNIDIEKMKVVCEEFKVIWGK